MYRLIITTASFATLAMARTDLAGCTSTDVSSPAGASIAYYVPGTGEICEFLDCGGGRAPPKTTVPGCAAYSGTLSYSPSYLPGYGAMETGSSPSSIVTDSASVADPTATSEANPTMTTSSESEMKTETESASSYAPTTTTGTEFASTSEEATPLVSSAAIQHSSSATPSAVGGAGNGTTTRKGPGGSSSNGNPSSKDNNTSTFTSGTPSQQTGAAIEQAEVWLGGVAILGLGAVLAVL